MKALDTNVIVRFLVNDDKAQGRKARILFENAERTGERYRIGTPVLLETIWVLSAVYDLARDDVLDAIESLTQMPILEFESPSHADEFVNVKHAPELVQASLEATGGDLARDVVLHSQTERPRTGIDLITSRQKGEDGFFLLTMTAGKELSKRQGVVKRPQRRIERYLIGRDTPLRRRHRSVARMVLREAQIGRLQVGVVPIDCVVGQVLVFLPLPLHHGDGRRL